LPARIDPRDKNQVRALTDALKKSRINVSANASAGAPPTDRSPVKAIDDTVQAHIPGGWVTIALAAVGFALLVKGRH
jgi:hypothetical protein